jgi:dUTP pyrophosphatase
LAVRFGVTVLNSPGTIDADYRGEIEVILINHGEREFRVTDGMRIAQLIVAPVLSSVWIEEEQLDSTVRSDGGFGSTGN